MAIKKSAFRQRMTQASEMTLNTMQSEYLHSRFDIGTWNKVKLRQALSLTNDHELAKRTLLTQAVHANHSEIISKKFIKKADALKKSLSNGAENRENRVRQRCRFLTLIHSLQILDVARSIKEIKEFKRQIETAIYQSKGIWCAGAIEIEIVSFELMEKIQSENGVSEKRKLDVCKLLSKSLTKAERSHTSHALIHFHGIVFANNEERFRDFEKLLKNKKNKNKFIWAKVARQIQFKSISEQFAGSKKSLNANLKDIARYITKGGNDWFAGKAYLQYKLAFENTDIESEEAWLQRNWRRSQTLRAEKAEEGLESILSLSKFEIIYLAKTIDAMMDLSRNRLGYLVQASSSPKKAAILFKSDAACVPQLPI